MQNLHSLSLLNIVFADIVFGTHTVTFIMYHSLFVLVPWAFFPDAMEYRTTLLRYDKILQTWNWVALPIPRSQ